jgi:hypothetical protein
LKWTTSNRCVSSRQNGNPITQGSRGNFVRDIRVNDVTLRGSDKVQPLTFSASSILSRGALVDLQVGIGLTNAARKYSAILSSTYRFRGAGVLSLINCPKRLGVRRRTPRLDRVADWRQRQHVCGSPR